MGAKLVCGGYKTNVDNPNLAIIGNICQDNKVSSKYYVTPSALCSTSHSILKSYIKDK